MSRNYYLYLFPVVGKPLSPEKGLEIFEAEGFRFDESCRLAKVIDDDGHLLEIGDVLEIQQPSLDSLKKLLQDETSLAIQCRSKALFFTLFFAPGSFNPHISLSWPKKSFDLLDHSHQLGCLTMLLDFASKASAGYVLEVLDAADFFEDCFLEIAGHRLLENSNQYGDFERVWVNEELNAPIPEGALERDTDFAPVHGFRGYKVSQE